MTESQGSSAGDFFAPPAGSRAAQPPGVPPMYQPPGYQPPGYQPVYQSPGYQPPGYQPPPSSGLTGQNPPPAGGHHLGATPGVPELVTVAYTLLTVFAAAGLYIAASLFSLRSDLSGLDGLGGYSPPGYGKEEFFFGGSGILGIALVLFMRSGSRISRGLASALSTAWGIWWLYELAHTTGSGDGIVTGSFGMTGTVATFAVLTVVAACVAIAGLPWTPKVRAHFSKP